MRRSINIVSLNHFFQLRLCPISSDPSAIHVNCELEISIEVVIVFDEMVYRETVHDCIVETWMRNAYKCLNRHAVHRRMFWSTREWLMVTESLRPGNFQYIFDDAHCPDFVLILNWQFLNIRDFRCRSPITLNWIFFYYYPTWDLCGGYFLFDIDKKQIPLSPLPSFISKYHLYPLGDTKTSTLWKPRVARWNSVSWMWMFSTKWHTRWLPADRL